MYFKPLLYQFESQSFIFFNIKYIDCFIEPFSFVYLFVYSLIVIFICRKLAHRQSYNIPKNTDLTGQTIIVTEAASGIGRVSSIEFVKLGAKVIVGIRGQIRAEQIAQQLENESRGTGKIIGYDLDLSNLSKVKKFADQIIENEEHVNILLNNAGTAYTSHTLTIDGLEIDFGTNHILDIFI
jgi:hypothetical protein